MVTNRHLVLMTAAALWASAPARAGIALDASFNTNGTPWATIERSPDQFHLGGTPVQESFYAGPFSVTATGWTSAGPFDAFCVDLWHDMGTSNPGIRAVSVGPLSGVTGAPYFDLVTDTQVGNKMAFLMGDYANGTAWTADQKGGFQLALWGLVDPGFRVTWTSTAGLRSAFDGIRGLFDHQSWDGVAAYDPSKTYGGGTLFQVTHDGNRYQDLVTYESGLGVTGSPPLATPEPSTLVSAVTAVLIGLAYAWLRLRLRPRRAAAA